MQQIPIQRNEQNLKKRTIWRKAVKRRTKKNISNATKNIGYLCNNHKVSHPHIFSHHISTINVTTHRYVWYVSQRGTYNKFIHENKHDSKLHLINKNNYDLKFFQIFFFNENKHDLKDFLFEILMRTITIYKLNWIFIKTLNEN